jgi:DNA relaxase NicK
VRFDAYSATFRVHPALLVQRISDAFPLAGVHVDRRKSALHYDAADVLLDCFDEQVCSVHHGGSNGAPHVRVQGFYSPQVVDVLRSSCGDHSVSRVDVAIDFDGPECWNMLAAVCGRVARDSGLKWTTIGDFREDRDELAGRTIYVGSRQSPCFVRLYEKGKQMLPLHRVGDPPLSLDWCRLEIEVKPPNRVMKFAASTWRPEQFWGCSSWSKKLLHSACDVDVERITMTARKETDARRAIRNMAMQYRSAMEAVIIEEGGDEAFMALLHKIWADLDYCKSAA